MDMTGSFQGSLGIGWLLMIAISAMARQNRYITKLDVGSLVGWFIFGLFKCNKSDFFYRYFQSFLMLTIPTIRNGKQILGYLDRSFHHLEYTSDTATNRLINRDMFMGSARQTRSERSQSYSWIIAFQKIIPFTDTSTKWRPTRSGSFGCVDITTISIHPFV